jgi:hypothetical protein
MYKRIFIQILLFIIISILIVFTFNFYKFDKTEKQNIESINKKNTLNNTDVFNVIDNLNYSSKDSLGNEYKINAKKSIISSDNTDLIFMSDVNAVIYMNNSEPITIKADFADYDSKNYDTIFKKNILLTHLTHKVKGEKLNLSFKKNLVTMSDSLIYTNINTKLYADEFEMDLITKNSKIFMNNKSKKVNILTKK